MVSSLVFPAYAGQRSEGNVPLAPAEIEPLTPFSDNNIIYQNGNNPIPGGIFFMDDRFQADDFVLGQSADITDAHFTWTGDGESSNIEPLWYFILTDLPGEPDAVIASGTAQNVQTMVLSQDRFETWFDFEDPVPLDGGVTYWFALKYTDQFTVIVPEPQWEGSDVMTGNSAVRTLSFIPVLIEDADWFESGFDLWFQLTGDDKVVGGEVLPIDSTALLLAGAQTFSWMIPVLFSGIGIGLFVVSRKSE